MEKQLGNADDIPLGGITYRTTFDGSKHDHSSHHHDNIYNNNTHYHYATDDQPRSTRRPQDRLEERVSHGALHNSAERGSDAPKCFPETRVAVQEDMISWMKHNGCRNATQPPTTFTTQRILWLSGPAGAGKTAIMGTIADECYRQGWLAASFFFSSHGNSPDRYSKDFLIPTLAYQLIQHASIVGLREEVLAALDRDPLILMKNVEAQVDELILRPLGRVAERSDQRLWPQLVLVDGLDECQSDASANGAVLAGGSLLSKDVIHREILSALVRASDNPHFPFCIIIASRPDRAIAQYVASRPNGTIRTVFLDSKYSPEADIELYSRAMLTKIGHHHGLAADWFSQVGRSQGLEDVPRYLAKESSGQFVYAATVIRFIEYNSGPPHQQLKQALDWRRGDTTKPFAALDALYAGILNTSPQPSQAALLICASRLVTVSAGAFVHAIMQSTQGEISHLLGPLASLVRTVDDEGLPDFHVYHKSLPDFLNHPERSGGLHVAGPQERELLQDRIYDAMKSRGASLPRLSTGTIGEVSAAVCTLFTTAFPLAQKHRYAVGDVDWWIASVGYDWIKLGFAYFLVHEKCRWYRCRPACKVWRKGIMRYAKANSWRVPTVLERLRDRVNPIPYELIGHGGGIHDVLHPPQPLTHRPIWENSRSSTVSDEAQSGIGIETPDIVP